MPLSKYARKELIRSLAKRFSDEDWEKLSQDQEFVTHLTWDTFDFGKAQARAAVLFPPKPEPKPAKAKGFNTIGAVMTS